jgi:hypothetical protein
MVYAICIKVLIVMREIHRYVVTTKHSGVRKGRRTATDMTEGPIPLETN